MAKVEVITRESIETARNSFEAAKQALEDFQDDKDVEISAAISDAETATANTNAAIDNANQAVSDLQTSDQQVQDAISQLDSMVATANAYGPVNFQRGFSGDDDLTVVPTTTGASEDDISWYLIDNEIFQIIRLESGSWEDFGAPISTKKYVDDKALLSPYIVANVKSYGATGDGVSDDTSAFLDAMSESDHLFIPDGHYMLESGLETGVREKFSIIGESYNAILDFTLEVSGNPHAITITGETEQIADIDEDVNKDDLQIVFSSDHGLSENDMFFIHNTTDGSFNPSRDSQKDGEICVVKSVDSTTEVTLTTPILSNYDISEDVIEVYKCNPVSCDLQNFTYIVGDSYKGILIDKSRDSNTNKVRIKGGGYSRLYFKNGLSATVDKVNASEGYNAPSNNYAVYFDGCQNCKVNNSVLQGETSLDMGGSSNALACNRNNLVTNNILIGRLTSHGSQDGTKYDDNTIIGSVLLRGGTSYFTNNNVFGNLSLGEQVELNHTITNNSFILFEEVGGAYNTAVNLGDVDATVIKSDGLLKVNDNKIITNGYSDGVRLNYIGETSSTAKIDLQIEDNECDASLEISEQYHPNIKVVNNSFASIDFDASFDIATIEENYVIGGRFDIDMLNPATLSSRPQQILKIINNYCVITEPSSSTHFVLGSSSGVSGDDIDQVVYITGENYFESGPSPSASSNAFKAPLVVNVEEVHINGAITRANEVGVLTHNISVYNTDDLYIRNINFDSSLSGVRRSSVTNNYRNDDDLTYAGDPNGNVTSDYPGRLCLDTANTQYYMSVGTGTVWKQITT